MKEKDVDNMLEICFEAVERMASHIEDQSNIDSGQPLNKLFHTLGAVIGNFLYTYQEIAKQPELMEAFMQGLHGYIKFCKDEDPEDFYKRPTRLIDWVIDSDAYRN